ncbi:MAG: nucleotidyltransferase domain-containing protein [Spirochaetaceae bacterium]|nr:MAG: nucleotidyltransferase domain-containing protein [Spirochaetaceae bacterium]
MSGDTTVVVSDEFRADVERAIEVLRSEGAKEIYVFGSIVEPESQRSPSDLDLAVSGLPPERFFHVHGVLLGELEHEFDLVDLDQDSRFVRALREWGTLERVG